MPLIVAPDGTEVPFDRERLERSLKRRGLSPALIRELSDKVEELLETHPSGSIPVTHLNPLIGEALIDVVREAGEVPASGPLASRARVRVGQSEPLSPGDDEPDAPVERREPATAAAHGSPSRTTRREPPKVIFQEPRMDVRIDEGPAPEAPARAAAPPRPTGRAVSQDPRPSVQADPWFAFRRALGLPADDPTGNDKTGASPRGMAFPQAGAVKTVYANDTAASRTICLNVAYSGHVQLGLPSGKRVDLEGIGREIREIEVPAGADVKVQGVGSPYSVVSWWLS